VKEAMPKFIRSRRKNRKKSLLLSY